MTVVTSSIVMDVSATLVATTILRTPGSGAGAGWAGWGGGMVGGWLVGRRERGREGDVCDLFCLVELVCCVAQLYKQNKSQGCWGCP
jgi:hypothetical protein